MVDGGPRATAAGGARRELTEAVLGSAAAGGLALSSSSQAWAELTVTRQPPLPPFTDVLTGGQAAPLVPACGLLLLAAGVAVLAVRGAGRVAVGLLVVAAGAGLAWSGLRGLTGGLTTAAAGEAPSDRADSSSPASRQRSTAQTGRKTNGK